MISIEKLTNNIAEKISLELELDNDRKEVVAYGVFALVHTTVSILLVVVFGLIFGVLIEVLIISFTGSILKKYSGGAHASSPGICASIGLLIVGGLALLILFLITPLVNLIFVILLGFLIFVWSCYIICKLAPVDSAAKPIKTQKKRDRMKKGAILSLVVYLGIVMFNIIMYLLSREKKFLVYSVCIYGGTAWQVFTLTYLGHLIIKKIDVFLNQILIYMRREK